MLEARGLVALPVDPELFLVSGVGGFYKRSYGSGWPLNASTPRFLCPALLYVTREHHKLSWAMRLVRDGAADAREQYVGLLRLTRDTAQIAGLAGGFSGNDPQNKNLVDVSKLGAPDDEDGWTVRGDGTLMSSGEGLLALSVYGNAPGLAVQWLAVAVAR